MAIVKHNIEGSSTVEQGPSGGNAANAPTANEQGTSSRANGLGEAISIVDSYLAGDKAVTQMQGWELKRLGEACKTVLGGNMNEHKANAITAQNEVRQEWTRRKGLSADDAKAEAEVRDEISERTGKPKKLPRGKPFEKGSDDRRNAGNGDGDESDEGGDENEGDEQGESGEQGEGDSDEQGEGEGESQEPPKMPKLPEESTEDNDGAMESIMRRIAREEDFKVVQAVDANFAAVAKEMARIARQVTSGGAAGGKTVFVDRLKNRRVVVDGEAHNALQKCVEAVNAGFRNLLIVGPAGSGKSTLGRQLAKVLHELFEHPNDFALESCSVGMTESVFTGRLLPVSENGTFSYVEPDFVRVYEGGGVAVIDELDAADANVLVSINGALADGRMSLPARIGNTEAIRNPQCVILGCANTWGHGADRMYVGRNQLDAATLRRFAGFKCFIDYDRDLEARLCDDKALLTAVWAIRDRVRETGIRRVWGTGELVAASMWRTAGKSIEASIRNAVGDDWTPDDLAKVGLTVAKPKGAY